MSCVDVRTDWLLTYSRIGLGNSLKGTSYEKDITKICRGLGRWLGTNFHRSFKNLGQTVPIGTQKDGISCGVCVLNALEHTLLDIPLFTHNRRNLLRMRYFTNITKLLLDHVSMTYDLSMQRTNIYDSNRCQDITRPSMTS